MSVAVLGAGAFGAALAVSLAGNGPVTLWGRSARDVAQMRATGRHDRRLPGVDLPAALTATDDLDQATQADILLLAVPMQQMRGMLVDHGPKLRGRALVACCKGIELTTGQGPHQVIADVLPDAQTALLTGPSFAHDIARGLPTALTLACADGALGQRLQQDLTTANLRLYRSADVIGAALGGALKNVIAIASGAVVGAGLGDSARAALMTRGFAEMQRMARALGAAPETLAGLSGFGDLILTCGSEQSRNYRFGLALGRGEPFDPSVTVEGAATARATADKAGQMGIELPITECVVGLLDQKLTLPQAMTRLLARPLKEETQC